MQCYVYSDVQVEIYIEYSIIFIAFKLFYEYNIIIRNMSLLLMHQLSASVFGRLGGDQSENKKKFNTIVQF